MLATAAPAPAAVKPVSFYAWVGGTAPYETLWGVSVNAAGRATFLQRAPQAPPEPATIGKLKLAGPTLAALRTAARRVMTAPTVTPAPVDGPE